MKALNPAIREHKRYLLLRGKRVKEIVERAILDYVGVLGYAKASPYWIKHTKTGGVLSVNREAMNDVRGALVLSAETIEVKAVSGTLKGLSKK